MNALLSPVLRKFALVFFDDILIYSSTYEEHIRHIEAVLEIMQQDKFQVKPSKCEFAQQRSREMGSPLMLPKLPLLPTGQCPRT